MTQWNYKNCNDVYENPKEFLKSKYQRGCFFGLDRLKESGNYLLMGDCINFKQYLKKYLIKQHGTWQEVFAPNKTLLRKSTYGAIQSIVELNT